VEFEEKSEPNIGEVVKRQCSCRPLNLGICLEAGTADTSSPLTPTGLNPIVMIKIY